MFFCLICSLAMGLGGLLVYLYYLRKGQFDDPEDVKYQMFREGQLSEGQYCEEQKKED